jgi:hypothetical protein
MATYCAVTDLQKYVTSIDNYDLKIELPDFKFLDLTGDKFSLSDSGSVIVAYLNGTSLGTAEVSAAAVNAANKWFYDSTIDTFYVQLASGKTPTDSDIELQRSPLDWASAKTFAIQVGTNKVNERLDNRFPRPLPEVSDNATGDSYDQAVVEMTALFACVYLIQASGSEDWMPIQDRIFNEEGTGILDLLNEGKIKLSFELTSSDGGSLVEGAINAATTGYPTDPLGTPSVDYDVYTITIGTGGTLANGTANTTITYSAKDLRGANTAALALVDGYWQGVGGGMSVRFAPGVYTANDTWLLTVKTEGVVTTQIGKIRMTRR